VLLQLLQQQNSHPQPAASHTENPHTKRLQQSTLHLPTNKNIHPTTTQQPQPNKPQELTQTKKPTQKTTKHKPKKQKTNPTTN
jgi:hypothetical protein